MSSIDERVVQMKFDNAQFESGMKQTQTSLDNLKKGLNLDASAKSLDNLNSAGSRFSLANIGQGIEGLASKFSALSIVGITALTNIANRAIDTGLTLVRSLTVEPIQAGLQEYETNLNSIQTILANTQVSGAGLPEVNAALSELNTYSDKTIYNFSEMARNIGTFTAAGVDLKTSTESIKGIANLAALSGSNSQQAATAMYQLSQAIASGKVGLQDWNSVVNAGMGGTTFQRALAQTAVKMGKLSASSVKLDGDMKNVKIAGDSFRDSISAAPGKDVWLTSDVLTTTLKQFTGDLSDAQVAAMGFNEEEVKAIQQTAQTAMHAATEVKTLSGVFDVAKETVGSGWAQTFQLIFGDFGEAKTLFTDMSNGLNAVLNEQSAARNELIKGWKDAGGRMAAIEGLKNIWDAFLTIVKTVGGAFREIFPPITAATLVDITNKFKDFTAGLNPGIKVLDEIRRIFKGVFAAIDIGWFIVQRIFGVFQRLFQAMNPGGAAGSILTMAASWGDWVVKVREVLLNSEKLNKFFYDLGTILVDIVHRAQDFSKQVVEAFKRVINYLQNFKLDTSGFVSAFENLRDSLGKLRPTGEMVKQIWDGLINIFKKGLEIGRAMADQLGEAFGSIGQGVNDGVRGINFNQMLGIISVALLGGLVRTVRTMIKTIKGAIEEIGSGGGILDTIREAFGGLTDTLGQMQSTLKASTLILIAGAIALLTYSVVELSKVDASKLPAVLAAMTVMFIQLSTALAVLARMNIVGSAGNMAVIGGAMILLAIAIRILAGAMTELSKLSWDEILKGLVGVTAMLIGLAGAAKLMSSQNGNMIATGIGLIAVAVGVKILASACEDFSKLSWEAISKGLVGVATVLISLALFTRIAQVSKGAVGQAVGIVILAAAIKLLASAVSDFGNIDPKKIQQGLGAVTLILGELALFTRATSGSTNMVFTATGLVILAAALKIMATAVQDFGNIPWDILGRGLAGMAGALVAVTGAMRLMPPNMLVSAAALVVVAAALKIMAEALSAMGGMSWEEIGKGFTVLASSLLTIAIAMDFMTTALPGAAALLVVAAALTIFVPVLQALGTMEWAVIGQGFAVLAAAFLLIGLAGLVLAPVVPALIGLGIAITLLGVGAAAAGLGMLAFSAGLTALAVAGAAGATALIAIVAGLLGLIPYAFQMIGEGIVAFAGVLTNNVPVFVAAAVSLMLGLLDGVRQVAPVIVDTLFQLLLMLINRIAEFVPQFVDGGIRIIVGFLNGIAGQIGNVVTAAVNILVNFLNGIANNMSRVIQAGTNIIIAFIQGIASSALQITNAAAETIIKFVNGLADSIDRNSAALRSAGLNLARAIVDGMTGGLASAVGNVVQSAQNLANSALDAARNLLGIHSPSREFFKIGDWSGQGLANGILSTDTLVGAASEKVGRSALDTMKEKLAGIWDEMSVDEFDVNPTITPVLDLTTFTKDAKAMSDSLAAQNLSVDSSYGKAAILTASTRAAQDPATQADGATSAGTNITYIQNNTSPKAISPVEIYRGTKNQLSTVKKGELVKN